VMVICPADREDRSVTQHLPIGDALWAPVRYDF